MISNRMAKANMQHTSKATATTTYGIQGNPGKTGNCSTKSKSSLTHPWTQNSATMHSYAIRYSFDKQGKIGDLSVGESESLKNILDNLDIQKGQRLDHRGRQGRIVQVDFGSNELNGDFAETLADTLRRFIEVVTPAVDNFMDERNEEDTDTIRLPAIPLTLTMKFVDKHNEEDA